jgi:hypothetical protein
MNKGQDGKMKLEQEDFLCPKVNMMKKNKESRTSFTDGIIISWQENTQGFLTL